jgi:biotin carboxylase
LSSQVDPVLVVGTTADYIQRISERLPDRAVFLTDIDEYSGSGPPGERGAPQVFSSLRQVEDSFSRLERFIDERGINLKGVACFDCESLMLAADIARRLSLPFASESAVSHSRDKLVSRRLWHENGVNCPRAIMARDDEDVIAFFKILDGPVVLKPTVLSGSELTYIVDTCGDAVDALRVIRSGLRGRSRDRTVNRDHMVDENAVLCEEYIPGDEYSCDFISDGREFRIVRTARKYLMDDGPAGTALAYEVPGMPAGKAGAIDLAARVSKAAGVLGFDRCMGMADFIMRDGEPCFLEVTPRPAGDCLPQVIEQSCGMDMLGAHLEFAGGRMPGIPSESKWKHTVGLRIHARRRGRLSAIRLWADRIGQEILETGWYREPGDRIALPPDDYRSWVMGHVIFRPVAGVDIADQIESMAAAVEVRIE